MKPSNDFRDAFNLQCEAERHERSVEFERRAMDAGADGRSDKIEYWQQRAMRLRDPRNVMRRIRRGFAR